MHEFIAKTAQTKIPPITTLTLPLDRRKKSRQRVVLDNGEHAGIFLSRGSSLQDSDLLVSAEGVVIKVQAASEELSLIVCKDPLVLARACYHLGNRHLQVQIAEQALTYKPDHVIDGMMRSMGLEVTRVTAPFEPECGMFTDPESLSHGH